MKVFAHFVGSIHEIVRMQFPTELQEFLFEADISTQSLRGRPKTAK